MGLWRRTGQDVPAPKEAEGTLLERVLRRAEELEAAERAEELRRFEEEKRRREAEEEAARTLLAESFGTEPKTERVGRETYWVVDDLVFLVRSDHTAGGELTAHLVLAVPEPLGEHSLLGRPCRDLEAAARLARAHRGATLHKDGVLAALANGSRVSLPDSGRNLYD